MLTDTQPTQPQKYIACICCGAILGYQIGAYPAYLFIYAYPLPAPRHLMATRRIAGRILTGDVYCCRCSTWQPWPQEQREK